MFKSFLPLVLTVLAVSQAMCHAEESTVTPEPKIVQVEEMKYVGLAITHRPEEGTPVIPQLWNKYGTRNKEITEKSGPTLGIGGDIKDDGSASYIAAAQVTDFKTVPAGMVKGTIPAGTYAEFKHKGPISTFGKTVGYIHGEWLPKSGYKNHGAMVEVYPKDCDVDAKDFEMTVLVPVSK